MNISIEALSAVAELQKAGSAGSFINAEAAKELAHHKIIDTGKSHDSKPHLIAARLTVPAGVEWATEHAEKIEAAHAELNKKPEVKPFEVLSGIPIPPVQRIPRTYKKASIYPLETMAIGESFHVPVTAKRPEPAKSFVGTMYSAQTRLRKHGGDHTFVIRTVVAATDPSGLDGARVWRVAPKQAEAQEAAE